MRVVILTMADNIYASIVLKELLNSKHKISVVVFSDVLMPGKSVYSSIRKIIKDSGVKYFILRSVEALHNRFLPFKNPQEFVSVKNLALKNSLQIYKSKNVNAPKFLALLKKINPDIIISIYFNQIIKKSLIELPKYGCINIHRAMLPKHRGPCSAFWTLAEGETKSGVTIHYIDEGMDTGDLILQEEFEITSTETLYTLCVKSALVGGELIVKALDQIEAGTVTCIPQNNAEATHYSFPTKQSVNNFLKHSKIY